MKSRDFIKRPILLGALFLFFCFVLSTKKNINSYRFLINEEEFSGEFSDFEGSAKYLFDMVKNPITKKIPAGIRGQELAQVKAILNKQLLRNQPLTNIYTFQGPENIGGRCRAVVHDVRYNGTTNRTMIAGGVSGGIYKSIDGGSSWIRKGPTDALYSVTSIAQDPRPGFQDTWYYGTGEFFTRAETQSPFLGDGVYKSTDNGESWTKLPASNTGVLEEFDRQEDCVYRVIVCPNGVVYMAAIDGIFKSVDGGNSWQLVLSTALPYISDFNSTDIVVTPSGRLYAAFSGWNIVDFDGVWTSSNGDYGSWTRIAGQGPGGDPTGWAGDNSYGRIVLAVTPTNENIVYAFVESWLNCPNARAQLFRWNFANQTWTDLTNNLPGCDGPMDRLNAQGGYDMVIAVKPDDPNTIFIGGQSMYRSTNGFTSIYSTTQIGGYNNYLLHPDMHFISFEPGNPSSMIVGNDGGMQLTEDNMASYVIWANMNTGFRTIQYYQVSMAPMADNNAVLGGSQDNGTTRNYGLNGIYFEFLLGGDGGPTFVSNKIGNNNYVYEYCSNQSAIIYRRNQLWPPYYQDYISPATPTDGHLFISPYLLDPDNTEFLYYVYGDQLFRTNSASTVTSYTWTELTGVDANPDIYSITALATTRGSYNSSTSSLFFGDSFGRIYRLDDPINCDPSTPPVNITNNMSYGYISSISVNPRNDDTVLVTTSSYGFISTWWTGNANSENPIWINVERNLTLPSARSSAIALTPTGLEYYVGTSVGLFKTNDPLFNDWTQEGATEIGNAVVSSLFLRPSDNRLLVGTYGYGMWVTQLPSLCSNNIWTGAIDEKWENPGNWSCGYCPFSDSHVIINPGTPHNPVLNSTVTIRQLTLNANAVLHVSYLGFLNITNPP